MQKSVTNDTYFNLFKYQLTTINHKMTNERKEFIKELQCEELCVIQNKNNVNEISKDIKKLKEDNQCKC